MTTFFTVFKKRFKKRFGLWVLVGFLVVAGACTSDSEEPPAEEESTTSSTVTPATTIDTTSTVGTTSPTTTTTLPEPVEEFPGPEVLAYLEDLRSIAVDIGQMALDMRAANNDWDNRSVTDVSYGETEEALVEIRNRAQLLRDLIGSVQPPEGYGLPIEHQTAWAASGEMADAATEALAGLRSPDTGERRRAGLNDFIIAFERFNGAINRIVDIIGVGEFTDLPVITVATTEATTTTSTTPAAQTTTTTTAAAETPTTSSSSTTTTTTEIEPTDSTLIPGPTTTADPAEVGFTLIDSGADNDGARIWKIVQVDTLTTKAQLSGLAARLSAEYRLLDQYQALTIYFSHFPEGTSTLGWWVDAPYGDWTRAGEVDKGDYSLHQVVDMTVEKDWSLLPTPQQMNLFRALRNFRETYAAQNNVSLPLADLIPTAATALGYSEAELRGALDAWTAWTA